MCIHCNCNIITVVDLVPSFLDGSPSTCYIKHIANCPYFCDVDLFTAVLTVQFSKSTFSGSETAGAITVTLLLGGGTSASEINVIVTPSDQSPVSARGKITTFTD